MVPNYHSCFSAVGSAHRYFHLAKVCPWIGMLYCRGLNCVPSFISLKEWDRSPEANQLVQYKPQFQHYFNTLPTKDICARSWSAESSQKCFLPGFFCDFRVPSSSFIGISCNTSTFSRLLWYHVYPIFFLIGIYPAESL